MRAIHFKYLISAILVIAAGAAFAGYPVIHPDMLVSMGMLAMVGNVEGVGEIKALLEAQGKAWEEFKAKNDRRLGTLESEFVGAFKKLNRPPSSDGDGTPLEQHGGEVWIDPQTKRRVPVLDHKRALASFDAGLKSAPSIGRVLRGIVCGGRADDAAELADERKSLGISSDPSGGYTVSDSLAATWIDLLRSQMVLSRAGALTVPMDTGTLSIARVTADPTVSWHAENGPLEAAEPTFGAVNLVAKTVVCLVKLSLELSQDSANIEQILQTTINGAMSRAIDSAGLVGVTANEGAAPSGIMNASGRNRVTSIGAPTSWDFVVDGMYELAADNVPLESIGAMVAHPAVWKKMAKLKTGISGDSTPLPLPEEVAKLPKLWTTAAPLSGGTTATGIIADWRSLLFGVRKDITIRVLTESFLGSNLQLAVLAYARCDFVATRQTDFCTLEGITV